LVHGAARLKASCCLLYVEQAIVEEDNRIKAFAALDFAANLFGQLRLDDMMGQSLWPSAQQEMAKDAAVWGGKQETPI
jgi:hypothetical protein